MYGYLVAGCLPELVDLHRQVVGPEPVRVSGRGALVNARRQIPHLGDLVPNLYTHEHAAGTGLGALPNDNLHGLGLRQVVRIEAVSTWENLVDKLVRRVPFSL